MAFMNLKKSIIDSTLRAQPNTNRPFIVTTDASNVAIGAILAQKDDNGREIMVYAFSKRLDKTQENYSTTDKELLAVVKSLEHFRHYLLGKRFLLRTDHRALEYLWSTQNSNSRLLRWALKLQEYDFEPTYIKGSDNAADILSRPNTSNNTGIMRIEKREVNEIDSKKILDEYHISSGHGGTSTIEFMIGQRYIWKGMHKDIKDFLAGCEVCLKSGEERIQTKNTPILIEGPNELWVCDLIGRLETKSKQNKFIFVAIDHFTKWVESKVIVNKTAKAVKDAVEELIILMHGIP